MYGNDTLVYSLQILKPDKPTAFFNCGIGWECTFKNVGVFQIKVEYVYEFSNYLSYCLTYLFSISLKSQQHEITHDKG